MSIAFEAMMFASEPPAKRRPLVDVRLSERLGQVADAQLFQLSFLSLLRYT